jgi:hypothetical protein
VGIPVALLGASFSRPKVATFGVAFLIALFVLATLLDRGPS